MDHRLKAAENNNDVAPDPFLKDLLAKYRRNFRSLWQYRFRFITINGVIAVLVVLYLLFLHAPSYSSEIVVLPDYGSNMPSLGRLSQLASIAGVNLNQSSPIMAYKNLLRSEDVLRAAIYKEYTTEAFDKPVNLIEYFEIEVDEDKPVAWQERAKELALINGLREGFMGTVIMDNNLHVSVTMPESKLSAEVVNTIILSLDEYIKNKRKNYASEQRFYIEKRLEQVTDSLKVVENELSEFKQRNISTMDSPNLLLRESRMMREIEILSQVLQELTIQLELTKLDEIKETAILNIRELARDPINKSGTRKRTVFLSIMLLSGLFTLLWYFFKPQTKALKKGLIEEYRAVKQTGSQS